MLLYNNKKYIDYLHLFSEIVLKRKENINPTIFPTYEEYMGRVALENKFNRKFSLREIKEILKDKTWQTHTMSLQTSKLKEKQTGVSI